MREDIFDPKLFYESYPHKVISRPGYPARAAFKSTFMFNLYYKYIFQSKSKISTYADIGGCFGFGANAMAYHISKHQSNFPKTVVYEISSDFVKVGKVLFPNIDFIEQEFGKENNFMTFDLVTIFDVIEHIVDPELFLRKVAERCIYAILKTPMETSGEWRGSKPPLNQGIKHPDGHINFFSPAAYEDMLNASGFEIIESSLIPSIVPSGAEMALTPEYPKQKLRNYIFSPKNIMAWTLLKAPIIPWGFKRRILGGGDIICLCKSRISGI